jgi:hypothetical protein
MVAAEGEMSCQTKQIEEFPATGDKGKWQLYLTGKKMVWDVLDTFKTRERREVAVAAHIHGTGTSLVSKEKEDITARYPRGANSYCDDSTFQSKTNDASPLISDYEIIFKNIFKYGT